MIPPGEFDLIHWIKAHTESPRDCMTTLGIGDDCAILQPTPGAELVVTTDMLMDGRHFVLSEHGPEAVGRKAMSVNLSDIAAMAAIPQAAFVAVALPRKDGRANEIARGLHAGIAEIAGRFSVTLAGGDTNAWDGPLVICITLIGQTPAGSSAVRRSGAKVGDIVFVTGPLGGSILGRHLRPEPRITEALALRGAAAIHALIDISDGLASDLGHILEESGNLGAVLDFDAIPIHEDAWKRSRQTGRTALDHALSDGEDFELCVVLNPEDAERIERHPPSPARLFRVGRIDEGHGLRIKARDGRDEVVEVSGFDHFC